MLIKRFFFLLLAVARPIMSLTVVKLGGAAITHKSLSRVVHHEALEACVSAIARAKDKRLAIVHGAGCFGHAEAKQFSIGRGGKDPAGAALTRQAVLQLSSIVVKSLVEAGVPATPLSPCSLVSRGQVERGSLTEDGESRVAQAVLESIEAGLVPVMHGDVVLDSSPSTISVLSGDDLVLALARKASARRAIFVTNVDGVYDKDPGHPEARHIPILRAQEDDGSDNHVDSSSRDATGGMRAKLDAALRSAEAGVPVAILKPNNLYTAISHDPFWQNDDDRPVKSTLILP